MHEQTNVAESNPPPRNKLKLALLAVATIPFAVKVAYLNQAWVSSPVDRARLGLWGSLALFLVVLAIYFKLTRRFPAERPLRQSRSLRVLPLAVILYLAGLIADLNAVQLVASVGILWATAWMLYGRTSGLMLAPAAVCAILAVPGSSYWLSMAMNEVNAPVRAAYAPSFGVRSQQGYLGSEVPATESFTRFFRTSDAHQYRYASRKDEVALLEVRVGDDIHEIHPATHCLRSSGWRICSEGLQDVSLAGRDEPLPLTEAVVSNAHGVKMLVWIWYSSARESTGSFIRFRHLYAPEDAWKTYQVTTFVESDGNLENARKKLRDFLEAGGGVA